MKYLVVLFYFVCSIVTAQPIRVQGIGDTLQQAKENAFKTAVELQVGSVLVTELESSEGKLHRNDIINYSAGYVDNYKIIETSTHNNKILVIVDVYVSSSKIANRILGVGAHNKIFDSNLQDTRYQTYMQSKNNADRLLKSLLDDYPKKAFVVTQYQHRFAVNTQRNPFIEIEFKFNWNYNYLVALNEVLSIIEDGSNGLFKTSPGNIVIMAKDPKDFILGKKNHYRFNDFKIMESVKNRFDNNLPRIQLSVYNHNNNIFYTECYLPESFTGRKPSLYSMGDTLIVYGNQIENNIIRINLANSNDAVRYIAKMELNVVGHESCNTKQKR